MPDEKTASRQTLCRENDEVTELRESVALLSKAQEIAHLGSWNLDVTTNRLSWSDEVYRIFGFKPQEFPPTYEMFLDCVHPEDRAAVDAAYTASLKAGEDYYEIEHRLVRKSTGEIRYVHEKCVNLRDGSGQVIRSIGMVQDITERKQTEEQLKRSEDSLKRQNGLFFSLLKNLTIGVFMVEVPSGKPLIANDAALKLLGRGILPDASGQNLSEVYKAFKKGSRKPYPPEEMPILLGMKGITSHIDDMVVERPDGTEALLEIFGSPVTDDQGRIWASLVSFSDISKRNNMEFQLRQTSELLSLFIKYSPIYAYIKEVTDGESRVLHASENFKEMIGIPGSRMTGKAMTELFPADMAAKITADDQAVVSAGAVLKLEEDFSGRSYHTIKFPIIQGGKTLLAGYTIDISERKQAEKVLRARLRISEFAFKHSLNELLTKVLDEAEALTSSQIGFFHFVDADELTLSLQTWSTNTMSSICNPTSNDGHYPLNRAGVWADCVRARRPVIHNDYDSLPNHKGLPPGHVPVQREVVVPIFRNKLIVGVLGVGNKTADYTQQDVIFLQHLANLAWDIIIRKRAEEALRSSEIKYSRLFESMTDAYVCVDMEGRIAEANSSYQELTGYSLEELTSLTYVQLTPAKWHAIEAAIIEQQVLTRGYSDLYEKEYQRKDGSIINVELKTFLLKDNAGHPSGMWAIIRDITERKVAEDALRQAKIAAEAANTAKSQFLANMSHEIRTPMNGVIGLIELLLSTELTRDQREYAELIKLSGKNLVQLLSDILDLSKIEADKIELENRDFDLQVEINGMVNLLSLHAQGKGLIMNTQIDPDVPLQLTGDAGRLRQILNNIIGNAIKFTVKGSILLHIRNDAEDEKQTTLRFLVTDTGIGIAQDKLEKIFEPFTQADTSSTRQYGGTGLGLAIARQLAKMMSGTIGVESVEGEGTTFWFTAVLTKQPQKLADEAAGGTGNDHPLLDNQGKNLWRTGGKNIRLLLAEDDAINQHMTKLFLEKSGYNVDVASDGREALKLLEENDYAVVLMDCMMPLLSGYEVTAIIRNPASSVRNHAIPVIALTANAMREDRESCLAAGMNDYLAKPIDVTKVLAVLGKWVSLDFIQKTKRERDAKFSTSNIVIFDKGEFVSRSMGDLELSRYVATIFTENGPEYIESIRKALAGEDAAALRQSAHKLKGAAATMALPLLAETANWLEEIAEAGEMERARELLPELVKRFEQALEALRELLVTSPDTSPL